MPKFELSRREVLLGAGVAPLLAQSSSGQPNLLLIQTGDLAAWMLGCYGNKEIRTPNLDALAKGGVRLNGFVCTPSGSPSRATLLTGRTPMQHGIHDSLTDRPLDHPPRGQFAPPASFQKEVMLSDILAARGYRCGYVGRWHMGGDQTPQHRFDFWYTLTGNPAYENPRISQNGQLLTAKGYLPELITEQSLRFLDAQGSDRPFFLVTSHINPQPPYEGHPQRYYDLYAKTPFETTGWEPAAAGALGGKEYLTDIVGNLRRAAAAITALDDQIAPLLKKLEQKGFRQNTLILFTSDSGGLLGRHGLWSDGLASDPINMYEEVMQVPMIFNWQGKTPVQATRPELVSTLDILPTLCDALGADAPAGRNLPGRSFLPLLQGRPMPPKQGWRNLVFGHFRNTGMARDNRFKVIARNDGKGPNELYDLRADVREKANQYDNPQFVSVRDRLTRELANWRKQYSN